MYTCHICYPLVCPRYGHVIQLCTFHARKGDRAIILHLSLNCIWKSCHGHLRRVVCMKNERSTCSFFRHCHKPQQCLALHSDTSPIVTLGSRKGKKNYRFTLEAKLMSVITYHKKHHSILQQYSPWIIWLIKIEERKHTSSLNLSFWRNIC